MIRNVLESISGIGILPSMGLIIFFCYFIAIVVRAFTMKKKDVEELAHIPLD